VVSAGKLFHILTIRTLKKLRLLELKHTSSKDYGLKINNNNSEVMVFESQLMDMPKCVYKFVIWEVW